MCGFFLGGEYRLRINNAHGIVEHRCECAETGVHEFSRQGLDGCIAYRQAHAGACHIGNLVMVDKWLINESDSFSGVVNTDTELAVAGATYEISLDLFGPKIVERFDEVEKCAHFEGTVDTEKLGEERREVREGGCNLHRVYHWCRWWLGGVQWTHRG